MCFGSFFRTLAVNSVSDLKKKQVFSCVKPGFTFNNVQVYKKIEEKLV